MDQESHFDLVRSRLWGRPRCDLSPDFFGNEWTEKFEVARKGAMPELAKMKEEGLIKGWGLGVNTLPPLLKTLEIARVGVCPRIQNFTRLPRRRKP